MKRYKMAAVWTPGEGGDLCEHPEGEWVKYEDVRVELEGLRRALARQTIAEHRDVLEALKHPRWGVADVDRCQMCGRTDMHNCNRADCPY